MGPQTQHLFGGTTTSAQHQGYYPLPQPTEGLVTLHCRREGAQHLELDQAQEENVIGKGVPPVGPPLEAGVGHLPTKPVRS